MDYQNVIEQARSCIGPYCRACPVCDGRACKNTMPGPGSKRDRGCGDPKFPEVAGNPDQHGYHL